MCGGPEQSNTRSGGSFSDKEVSTHCGAANPSPGSMIDAVAAEDNEQISQLLELAACNDMVGFQEALKEQKAKIAGVGSWYGRQSGTAHMVWEQRTPAMIAALYGSVDVLKYVLSFSEALESINRKCGADGSTALHCAAAGGSACAVETIKVLLDAGADLHSFDARGRRPADVIAISPKLKHVKRALESLLKAEKSEQGTEKVLFDDGEGGLFETDVAGGEPLEITSSSSFSSPEALDGSLVSSPSPSSSPKALDLISGKGFGEGYEKVKEYFVDPSIPDIKNSLYTTDEFRMFSFKIRPCSRAYSHDWTECPFVHPGENARRRDPRRYHYSCVPCPDFRKGACRQGDACEYAHGVFECWLHPAQYRTRICKDGTDCTRRVCFFAHTTEELRPLYISSGSTIPCPRTTSPLDMVGLSPPLGPCSPTSARMMCAFSSSNSAQLNLPTSPISPSSSPGNSLAGAWSPTSVPALHLPGVSLQASRLRSSLNARDISVEDFGRVDLRSEFDGSLAGEIPSIQSHALSTQARLNAAVAASGCNTSVPRFSNLGLTVQPTSLEELFSSDTVSSPKLFSSDTVSSPKSMMHDTSFLSQMEAKMQLHRASSVHSHVQGQVGSPKLVSMSDQFLHLQQTAAVESQLQNSPCMVSSPPSFSLSSRGCMTALGCPDIDMQTCNNSVILSPSVIAARSAFAQRDKRSHSSRDLGAGCFLSDWGSPTGKPEWGVQKEDLCKFRKSASFGFRASEEPDLSWVQKPVKEGPMDADKGADFISNNGGADHSALKSWMENMHLDQIVA